MAGVPGVVDLSVEQQTEIPVLTVKFDRPALARHGVTIREVARVLEAGLQGVKATRIIEGQSAYDLVVRLADADGWRTDTLGDLLVDTPAGAKVAWADDPVDDAGGRRWRNNSWAGPKVSCHDGYAQTTCRDLHLCAHANVAVRQDDDPTRLRLHRSCLLNQSNGMPCSAESSPRKTLK